MNVKEIKELVKLLVETDITELNLESDGTKIVIKKGNSGAIITPMTNVSPVTQPPQTQDVNTVPQPTGTEQGAGAPKEGVNELASNQVMIIAPMVGTFYRAASPGTEPFVEVGRVVEEGDVLCIIEAMKLMNEIESDMKGRIVEILVENGQPVEYGQPMFLLEKV